MKDEIDMVMTRTKQLKKPGVVIYEDDTHLWKHYKLSREDRQQLKKPDKELIQLNQQQENARDKF